MPNFLVAHPHKGWDGTRRTPGEVVTVSADEASVRVRDGFGRVVPAGQPERVQDATGGAVATTETAGAHEASEGVSEGEADMPKMSSPKQVWLEFLAGQGHDLDKLDGMTRGELIALAQARG